MMKRNIVLISLFAAVGMQQLQAAAPLSWVQGTLQAGAQKTREKLKVKYRQALQSLQSFQSYLTEQEGCILSGACPPGVKKTLVQRAKKVGMVIAALAVLLGTAYFVSREQEEPPVKILQATGIRATNVGDILRKWKVAITPDDSLPALFIKAVTNGAQYIVTTLYDLVPKNVLQAGREIAKDSKQSQPIIYGPVFEVVKNALDNFDPSQLKKNLLLIYSANTGLEAEVKASVCSSSPPSKNAIMEALEEIKNEVKDQFVRIKEFLQNPVCPTS
jgi:hypothetical protein